MTTLNTILTKEELSAWGKLTRDEHKTIITRYFANSEKIRYLEASSDTMACILAGILLTEQIRISSFLFN